MELKDALTTHLSQSGEPIDALAERAGVSRATIYRIKSGDYGDYTRIKRIVDAIGRPVAILPSLPAGER